MLDHLETTERIEMVRSTLALVGITVDRRIVEKKVRDELFQVVSTIEMVVGKTTFCYGSS